MLKPSSCFALAALCIAVVPACSESDPGNEGSGGSGGSGAVGSGGTGGTGIIGTGGSGGGNAGTAGTGGLGDVFDGGSISLTPDEVEEIEGQACAGWRTEGEAIPSLMELVVDVSSSMRNQAPGSNRSKWEETRDALLEAIVGVDGPGLPASVAVGMLFYPNRPGVDPTVEPQDINACVNVDAMVPVDVLGPEDAPHRSLVRNGIEDVETHFSTPTHDAFQYALNNGLIPAEFPGRKFMLLITDGTPTVALGCSNPTGEVSGVDPQPIVDEIQAAAELGIRTFLIGSPGSEENREWMSIAAVLGGTAAPGCNVNGPDYCHMDMTTAPDFSAALRDGLAQIAGQISPCTYGFAEPPPGEEIDENKINVIVTSEDGASLIVRDDVGDCTEGWQLTDDDEVLLCPETCAKVQIDPSVVVRVAFGCGSISGPIR